MPGISRSSSLSMSTLFLGIVAGAAAVLLVAPHAGKEVRQRMSTLLGNVKTGMEVNRQARQLAADRTGRDAKSPSSDDGYHDARVVSAGQGERLKAALHSRAGQQNAGAQG